MLHFVQVLQLCVALAAAAPAIESRDHATSPPSSRAWGWLWGWHPMVAFTTNGPILGHAAPNSTDVIEFLGIPFAEPPVGDLRFAAPVPYKGSCFQIASDWGASCPAAVSNPSKYPDLTSQANTVLSHFTDQPVPSQGEDCLSLNIWTKRTQRDYGRHAKLSPVIVTFHGGRFAISGTNTPFFYGQFWADAEDVVIVTVNFRLNIFGFPGVPGQKEQNLHLRDQRLAVEWVRDNIAAFGGDPAKINILGQSAGAVAVDYWAYAYVDDPIVSGLISHSGNAFSFGLNPDGVSTKNWYNVSASLGCGSSGDTLACMRQQKWQDIEAVANKVPAAKSNSPLRGTSSFNPIVDNVTVFADYTARTEAGNFAKVPYLLGNNNFEQGFYQLTASGTGTKTTQDQGDQFLLSSFTCPDSYQANARAAHNVPVYSFRYFGDWDNLRLYPTSGAYHGSDVDVLFGNDQGVSYIAPSQAERETTAWMQRTWVAFANDPAKALEKLGWPLYNESTDSLARIAYNDSSTPDYVSPTLYDGPCSTVTLGGLTTGP